MFRQKIAESIKKYFRENEGAVESAGVLWEAFKITIRGECIGAQAGVLRDIRRRGRRLADEISHLEHAYESDPSTDGLAKMCDLIMEYNDTVDQELKHRSHRYIPVIMERAADRVALSHRNWLHHAVRNTSLSSWMRMVRHTTQLMISVIWFSDFTPNCMPQDNRISEGN